MLLCTVVPIVGAEEYLPQTNLFLQIDTYWNHTDSGDVFVVRTDTKNIGEYPAFLVLVNLENIPSNWQVRPHHQFIGILEPGQTKTKFFIVERGETDATIYAKADAYNSPPVVSNTIPIPINVWIVVALAVVCGALLYRETKIRKKHMK